MLVLIRTVGRKVFLQFGTTMIEVQVAEIVGRKVRLGITAPDHVKIWRDDAKNAPDVKAVESPK